MAGLACFSEERRPASSARPEADQHFAIQAENPRLKSMHHDGGIRETFFDSDVDLLRLPGFDRVGLQFIFRWMAPGFAFLS